MAYDRRPREIVVAIHGRKHGGITLPQLISANVFQRKFQILLAALKEADRGTNGKSSFTYGVSDLAIGSAIFAIREEVKRRAYPDHSAIETTISCVDAIYRSNFAVARQYNGVAGKLLMFCKGIDKSFDRIDIGERAGTPIPIDSFFEKQINRFASGVQAESVLRHFQGQSYDAFDGVLGEIDFRGQLKRGILVLSGTRHEITCVFPKIGSSEELRKFGDRRVWVSGNAIYDGMSELPDRLEVFTIESIEQGLKPSTWRGVLTRYERNDWGSDIDALN